jgi:hypothetical protein
MIEIQTDPALPPDQPDWCTCTYCREMPEGEKVCCKENSEKISVKSIGKCPKNTYIIEQNQIFSKNYCEVISG